MVYYKIYKHSWCWMPPKNRKNLIDYKEILCPFVSYILMSKRKTSWTNEQVSKEDVFKL